MPNIEILDAQGRVINTIVADEAFAEQVFPGAWRLAAKPEQSEPSPPEWLWYIDHGPFYDRFGEALEAVLTSDNIGVKASIANLQARKWIDLKGPDVARGLRIIGAVIPAVTPDLQQAILTKPVTDEENWALRKTFFS